MERCGKRYQDHDPVLQTQVRSYHTQNRQRRIELSADLSEVGPEPPLPPAPPAAPSPPDSSLQNHQVSFTMHRPVQERRT